MVSAFGSLFGWHTQSSVWTSGRPDLAQRESAWLVLPLRRYWSLAIPLSLSPSLSPFASLSLPFWRTQTRWCVPAAKLPDQSRGGAFLCAALSIDPLPEVLSLPLLPRPPLSLFHPYTLSSSTFPSTLSFLSLLRSSLSPPVRLSLLCRRSVSLSPRFPPLPPIAPAPLVHFPLSSSSRRLAFPPLFVRRALVTPFNPSSYSSACNRVPFSFFFPLTRRFPFSFSFSPLPAPPVSLSSVLGFSTLLSGSVSVRSMPTGCMRRSLLSLILRITFSDRKTLSRAP